MESIFGAGFWSVCHGYQMWAYRVRGLIDLFNTDNTA